MTKTIRVVYIYFLLLFITACGSTSQVTEPPVADNNSASQVPENVPTQSTSIQSSTQPAAEPSGLKVAFLLEGNIWFWSEATPARQLTTDGDAAWLKLSDDGKVIAFTRGQGLWAINSDGTNLRELVADVSVFTGRPYLTQIEFQPGTHIVYFSSRSSIQSSVGDDLNRVDADSPTPQTLLHQGGQFTFSPDGKLLALANVDRINILRTDNVSFISALDFVQVNTYSDWLYYPQVVWLNDSTGFYTVIPASDPVAKPGQKARFLYVAADGSFSAQLAEFATADIRVGRPFIAPNGSKVVYLTSTDQTFDIHVIDASTADAVIATYPISPQFGLWNWSLDSTRFTYWTEDPSRLLIAGVNLPPVPAMDVIAPYSLTWVDANRFLYLANGELRLGQVGNPNLSVISAGFRINQDGTPYAFAP